jgi:CDP-glucose 4,6-dehydratase
LKKYGIQTKPLGKFGMSSRLNNLKKFWKKKKVFITGHTGFKGSWLTVFFHLLGAKVYGYSLKQDKISLYNIANIDKIITKSYIGDIRDYTKLKKSIQKSSPDFLIHMAAQPLVRFSYDFPKETYEVNAIGTLNVLNILNQIKSIRNILIITTDKVYKNINQKKYFKEDDELGGHDPYSNSKACAELICQSYYNSFLSEKKISCVTARAGNVIGGGDFAINRIIPDFFRCLKSNKKLVLRYPDAIRPWQHVIEPLYGYVLLLMNISKNKNSINGAWNFGPKKSNNLKVKKIISILNENLNNKIKVYEKYNKKNNYKESDILKLSSNKSKETLNWKPKYNINQSIKLISDWYKAFQKDRKNILGFTQKQILNYINQF